jgi:hypothetical protein
MVDLIGHAILVERVLASKVVGLIAETATKKFKTSRKTIIKTKQIIVAHVTFHVRISDALSNHTYGETNKCNSDKDK